MRAVVTGPTGGVGSALVRELLAQGLEVTAVVRPGSARAENLPADIEKIELSLQEIGRLPEFLSGSYDYFFHFGWNGTYGASRQDAEIQGQNIEFTLEAAKAAAKLGCQAFIGAGSQSEFGHVDGVLTPDTPCAPDTEYGKAKLAACAASRAYAEKAGMRHIWLRILSAYGPGDADYTMVMGTLRAFLTGTPRSFTKGDQIWDYIYTKDLARAFYLAAERGKSGAVYVAGSGKTRTLRAYIEAMRDLASPERSLTFGEIPYYPNQVMHLEADISALTADTGFVPRYSFEEGIRETIDWIRTNE